MITTAGGPSPPAASHPVPDLKPSMRHALGRTLQLLGLIILPAAIAAELSEKLGLGRSMLMAAWGAGLFYVGYLIQPRG